MDITFINNRLRKEFNDRKELLRNRGKDQSKKILMRMSQISAAPNLQCLRPPTPGGFHELTCDKDGWITCDLDGKWRLVFEPDHNPIPEQDAGGLDWNKVTAVRIRGVVDPHDKKHKKPV